MTRQMARAAWLVAAALMVTAPAKAPSAASDDVHVVRVPDSGIQPEVAVDRTGMIHLVYLAGEPSAANVFYARSSDGGKTFSRAVRANSQDGSAIATGTIRGAQIALGPSGRVHIAWNGSDKALPKPPVNPKTGRAGAPMLYARSSLDGGAFEPQRNLITQTTNLDGGGSIAADDRMVYVAWHAHPADGRGGEEARRVWISQSADDGATFAKEQPVSDPTTGVCGCCALRLFAAPGGGLHLLYRSATNTTLRDMYSLVSRDQGRTFQSRRIHEWQIGACPMTSMTLAASRTPLGGWETDGQVYFASIDPGAKLQSPPMIAPSESTRRKHPRLAINQRGTVMLVWTEGMSWGRGGSLAWLAFGPDGRPTEVKGSRTDVPVWSVGTVVSRSDGAFTILY
jgi:hypothetical protein